MIWRRNFEAKTTLRPQNPLNHPLEEREPVKLIVDNPPRPSIMPSSGSIVQHAIEASEYVHRRLQPAPLLESPQIAIICGSGLGGLADGVVRSDGPRVEIGYQQIPHFPVGQGMQGTVSMALLVIIILEFITRLFFREKTKKMAMRGR